MSWGDTQCDVTKDAVNTLPYQLPTGTKLDVSAEAAPKLTEVYFTQGELLPWKGRWFRIHLNNETKRIELEMLKSTAKATKMAERTKRWFTRHPNSQRAQAQRFQQLAGVLSGSAASALASSSTTAGT